MIMDQIYSFHQIPKTEALFSDVIKIKRHAEPMMIETSDSKEECGDKNEGSMVPIDVTGNCTRGSTTDKKGCV